MAGITLLGLGPGDASQLTREAWEVLSQAGEIWLRTRQHPAVDGLPASLVVHSFDELYETGESFDAVYARIVERVLALGARLDGVIYAVPGHPFVAEATGPKIMEQANQRGLAVRVVEGISFLEPVCSALGMDYFPHSALVDAFELVTRHVPNFPPDAPALVSQVYNRMVASDVKLTLNAVYPDEHQVTLIHAAGTKAQLTEKLPLFEMDRSEHIGLLTVLYVPPLATGSSFEQFQEIIARLRAPDGCPWDQEQTHLSLRQHLLEEAYETLAAIDSGDIAQMREEFGDLLLQIVLNAQIASEEGEFGMADIIKGIHDKIVRRHPHVFGDMAVSGVDEVLQNWEKLKAAERKENKDSSNGLLDGVPLTLPALSQAQEYQARAARVGFDWPNVDGVLDKIREEIDEVEQAGSPEALADELGDLLFSIVNLIRWKGVEAESTLRAANMRFKRRFGYVEKRAAEQGRPMPELGVDVLEQFWQEAKSRGL